MLPGLTPRLGSEPAEFSLSLVSFLTARNTGSLNIGSSGRQAGDLCIFFDRVSRDEGAAVAPTVTPSGFTQLSDSELGNMSHSLRASISAKLLAGTETTLTGMANIDRASKAVLIFRPSQILAGLGFSSANRNQQIAASNRPIADQVLGISAAAVLPVLALAMRATITNDPGNIPSPFTRPDTSAIPDVALGWAVRTTLVDIEFPGGIVEAFPENIVAQQSLYLTLAPA